MLMKYTRWTVFHILMASTFCTGAFMAASAADLDALAPIIVALGICAMFFAAVGELLWGARVLIRHLALWVSRKRRFSASEK